MKEQIRLKQHLLQNSAAVPGLVDFNTPAVLVALAGLAITIFFVVKGIKGGIILSILTTTVLAIAVGLVDLSSIDFCKQLIFHQQLTT